MYVGLFKEDVVNPAFSELFRNLHQKISKDSHKATGAKINAPSSSD
jgi:hypothetical protein